MSLKNIGQAFAFSLILVSTVSCSVFAQATNQLAEASSSKKIAKENLLRNDIVDFAKDYVGTRYRSGGKAPGGFDCSGYVGYIMREFDIKMSASSASQESQGKKIDKKDAQPGDLLFFRRSKGGRVFHVAMVLDNKDGDLTIIHSSSRGVIVDKISDSAYWRSKVITARDVVSDNL